MIIQMEQTTHDHKEPDRSRKGTGIGDSGERTILTKHGFRTTPSRSQMMRKIKGTGTKAEKALGKALWARGYRYRKNYSKLPGKPDLVFNKYKVVVFVDGGFWHGQNWRERKARLLANLDDDHRKEYWINKIEGNMRRDIENGLHLSKEGWKVFRFWDYELAEDFERCLETILTSLENRRPE